MFLDWLIGRPRPSPTVAQEYAAMSVVAEPKASKAMESMNPNPWIWILERKMKEMHLTNQINSPDILKKYHDMHIYIYVNYILKIYTIYIYI